MRYLLTKILASVLLFTFLIITPLSGLRAESRSPAVLLPTKDGALNEHIVLDRRVWEERGRMLAGTLSNLWYLAGEQAEKEYKEFEPFGITRAKVAKSLGRFFVLLLTSHSFEDFQSQIINEFDLFRSPGHDGHGTVKFTAYFRPVYQASRFRDGEFQYPIFRLPLEFKKWAKPHPSRIALEGIHGRGGRGTLLEGHELAFLRSRYEAFMIHVQGSAVLEFPDKSRQAIGFAAGTEHPFRGISASFLRQHKVAWHKLGDFFGRYPELLHPMLNRNNRFIFFKDFPLGEPIGSLGVPIIGGRSIATDKGRLPPGALGIIQTKIPTKDSDGKLTLQTVSRLVLDHDTGSAIKGPGRVDLYMGTGKEAMKMASSVFGSGELFYLFLGDKALERSA